VSGDSTLPIRGLRYHARERGPANAPAALLLHGFSGSSGAWEPAMEALARRGFRAIAVDLPGHGATGRPDTPERYAIEETALDLVALLDDADAFTRSSLAFHLAVADARTTACCTISSSRCSTSRGPRATAL